MHSKSNTVFFMCKCKAVPYLIFDQVSFMDIQFTLNGFILLIGIASDYGIAGKLTVGQFVTYFATWYNARLGS